MKRYFYTTPSYYGMGSDYDVFYLTEDQLRHVIKNKCKVTEDDRVEGMIWERKKASDATYCRDFEDRYIADRLQRRTTYAGWPDLLEIPEDVQPEVILTVFDKKIFIALNIWQCSFDIIAGHTEFTQYHFNFCDNDPKSIFGRKIWMFDKKWFECTEFSMNNVLINSFSDNRETTKNWCLRMLETKHDNTIPYKKILEKVNRPLKTVPNFKAFLQKDRKTDIVDILQNERPEDYADEKEHLLKLPHLFDREAAEITFEYDDHYYIPDEMFKTGATVTCFPIYTGAEKKRKNLKGIAFARAFDYIFQI